MMTIIRQTFIMVLCAVALTGCGSRRIDRQLLQAESLMQQSPDSALTVLRTIDGSRLSGERQARHALLLSQAFDKNYIDLTDDSLINIAYDFYRNSPDDRRLMQAAYYKAVVIYNGGNYLQSMKFAAIADTLANRLGDHKFAGLSASILLYNNSLLHSRQAEMDYGYKARKHFLLANDSINAQLVSHRLAITLISARLLNNAANIIDSITDPTKRTELLASLYCFANDEKKLDSILNIMPALRNDSWLCSQRAQQLLASGGDLQKVRHLLATAIANAQLGSDTTAYNWAYSRLAKAEGRFDEYAKFEEWYEYKLEVDNTYYQQMMTPHTYGEGINILHDRDINVLNQKKSALRNLLFGSISFIVILVLIVTILILNHARKKAIFEQKICILQAEHNQLISIRENQLSEASSQREALLTKLSNLESQISNQTSNIILSNQLELLLTLSTLYKYAASNSEQREIAHQIQTQISKFKNKEFFNLLKHKINASCDNLIDNISKNHILKETDIDLLIYFYVGLPINIISIITEQTPNYVSVHRHRIKERLKNAGFADDFLCKPLDFIKKF